MKYILKVYCISEFGQRKDSQGNPHQEDSVFPSVDNLTDNSRTFILCDGMGGHEAGEVASSTVCETMGNIVSQEDITGEGYFTPSEFQKALDGAFKALDEKDNGSPKKMGTTMTFLKLHNKGVTIAHIGDSRVYHIRPGKEGKDTHILFETEDHSLVNDLIKIGEITKEEARSSKQKNVITRAMQPNLDRRPSADIYETSDIKPGDYFYMCSDGMLEQPDMESGETIRNIFSEKGGDGETKVRILRSVTDHNKDNHTAFIIHIMEVTDLPVTHKEFVNKSLNSDYPVAQISNPEELINRVTPVTIKDNPKTRIYKNSADWGPMEIQNKGSKGSLNKLIVFFSAIAAVFLLVILFKPKGNVNTQNNTDPSVEQVSQESQSEYHSISPEERAADAANKFTEPKGRAIKSKHNSKEQRKDNSKVEIEEIQNTHGQQEQVNASDVPQKETPTPPTPKLDPYKQKALKTAEEALSGEINTRERGVVNADEEPKQ